MIKPKISIGISFKDPGKYFKLAIQSIFAQTFTDWELILIDDGSSDRSLEFVRSLEDERIRVYCDGETRGLAIRLNQLVQLARAEYFARMDADDIMHPQRLERQYEQLVRQSHQTVIGSAAYSINANSQVVGVRSVQHRQLTGFAARHSFIHPTVTASVEWFRRNPYNVNLAFQRSQDAELWCRTTDNTQFINLPEPLLFYRESGVFSLKNYLGTSLGLLQLMTTYYNRPRFRFLVLFFRELIKLAIVCVADCFSFADFLVAMRYRPANSEALKEAIAALAIVHQQQLPTRENCYGQSHSLNSLSS